MIVCRTCGSHNADADTFCGSCGEFLEWTGEKLTRAEPPPPDPQPDPPPPDPQPEQPADPAGHGGLIDRLRSALSDQDRRAASGPSPPAPEGRDTPPPAEPPPSPSPPSPSPPSPSPAAPSPAAPSPAAVSPAAVSPAAALVAPTPPATVDEPGEAAVGPRQPTAMRPQEPRRRTAAAVQAPPTRQLHPGDLVCGDCGEGNPPERRFCSRCGHSLHAATTVRVPWWRRLLRRRTVRPAGDRPRRPSARAGGAVLRWLRTALRRGLAIGLLLAGLLYLVAPGLRGWVNEHASSLAGRVQSWISPQPLPVRPISVTATGELPDHRAGAATDGFSNTFWAAPDAAAEPTLVLDFEQPVGLDRALVQVGGGEDFQGWGRPKELHLVYSNGRAEDVTVIDTPGPQKVTLDGGDGVTRVEIHVVSAYRSVQNPGLALSEIELYELE